MRIVIWTIIILTAVPGFAQRYQDYLALGDMAIEANDPYGALRYYREAMNMDSSRTSLHYKLANAYRLNENYPQAAYYYYQVYRKERGRVYEDSGLRLAEMQMQAGDYESAKDNWRRVRDQFSENKDSYEYQKALQAMRSCDLAKSWLEKEENMELIRLPEPVNTGQSEFNGQFNDEGTLFFTSLRAEVDSEGRLLDPEGDHFPRQWVADSTLTAVDHTDDSSVLSESRSPEGDYRAVLKRRDTGNLQIELFHLSKWITSIPGDDDPYWYSQPCFGRIGDQDVLFFSSNRPGGYGNEDLWFVPLEELTAEPTNAGPNINSPGREVTPFFNFQENKLYFASDWHHGMGGFDLFSSKVTSEFSVPENLKPPYSSPSNDLYYHYNEKTGRGTISTNRVTDSGSTSSDCCNDIWMFNKEIISESETLPEITTLEMLNDYLPVRLYFHNDEPNPSTWSTTTEKTYDETYRNYISRIEEYRSEYRKGLSEEGSLKAENAMDNFFLNEVDQGMFDLELFAELLLRELEKGARIELTVKGFASPLAKTDYNVNLTSRRIASLENYLLEFQQGAFAEYLASTEADKRALHIVRIPFGEYTASTSVSDNPNESDAIYSIGAALERKIEIVSVQQSADSIHRARLIFDNEIADLGNVSSGDTLRFEFKYRGSEELKFDSLSFNKSLVFMEDNPDVYSNEGAFKGTINAKGRPGLYRERIIVRGNFLGGEKELTITYEIVD
jgi:tetratricopeptide (TPR) repeat protein